MAGHAGERRAPGSPRWRRPLSWWKPSIRSSTFFTVRTCGPASARTCGAGSGSGSTFLVGSPCRSSPAGAWTVIQENRADRWARWLLTVAGAIADAVPFRPMLPSAARWSRQAVTSRGVTAETRSCPSPVTSQPANLSRCRPIFPATSSDRTPRTAWSRYRCAHAATLSSASAGSRPGAITFREVILRRSCPGRPGQAAGGRGCEAGIRPIYFTEGLFPERI